MGFVFRKCNRGRSLSIAKATGKKAATLKRLKLFLDAEEPQTVKWLVSTWDKQQAAVTYMELREAILAGGLTEKQLKKWQKDYAQLVNTKLAPQWAKAMTVAAEERKNQFPYFLYDPSVGASQAYIQQHGAELVTNLITEQKNAIQAIVTQATQYNAMTADNLSRIIRPVIGLTKPQATANLNYYNGVKSGLLKAHPHMAVENAEKKAREAAAKYAAQQHRYRAMNIARTELAMAYNQGGYGATIDAQEKGYIGDCKKTWLTAADERVCPSCGGIDGESVNMNDTFSNGVKLPPAHPQCRCAVAYEEVAESLTPTAANSTIETEQQDTTATTEQPPTQDTQTSVEPQAATDAPLLQAGEPIKPEAAIPEVVIPETVAPEAVAPEVTSPTVDGVLMATDVFGDLSLVPDSSFGLAVRSDSGMVEGQNLTARKITIDGFTAQEYYEISGKLTEEAWEEIAKNVQKRGFAQQIDFELGMAGNGLYTDNKVTTSTGRVVSLDGYKLMTVDQGAFEIYADYTNKELYGFGGYFRARVPVTGHIKADTKAMNALLDKSGLSALTANPTQADELLLKKSRLAWQHAPARVEEYEKLTGKAREKKLDEILKSVGINAKRVEAMELQEVFPGYSTYVDTAAAAQYEKAGLVNVWAGVTNPDAVLSITQGQGFVATNYRITSGMKMYGASPESDMRTGGSDSVFTRIGVNTGKKQYDYANNFLGDKYRIIIDPKEMARTDWYSYTYDNYGRASKSHLSSRDAPLDFIKNMTQSYADGNEIMFRRGISKDSFVGISCENATLRQQLIDKYRAAGVQEINGTPIDKFIYISEKIGK